MNWIETYTGKKFDFCALDSSVIDIMDIAHALSFLCRYTGHCRVFYSVAQHSVLMSRMFLENIHLARWALLHDAAEAYMNDINSALKELLPDYNKIESDVIKLIANKFGLVPSEFIPDEVRRMDIRMLKVEGSVLFPSKANDWGLDSVNPLEIDILSWPPYDAEKQFLKRYDEIFDERIHGDG